MESDKLAPAAETCEGCHSRERFVGDRLRVITQYKDDEANSPSYTVLMMKIGGGVTVASTARHGPGAIRYAAADKSVEDSVGGVRQHGGQCEADVFGCGREPGDAIRSPSSIWNVSDCHNRAAHSFEVPNRRFDRALTFSQISPTLPFAKKEGLELLKATYSSNDDAAQKIPAAFTAFYQQNIRTSPKSAPKTFKPPARPWPRSTIATCSRT